MAADAVLVSRHARPGRLDARGAAPGAGARQDAPWSAARRRPPRPRPSPRPTTSSRARPRGGSTLVVQALEAPGRAAPRMLSPAGRRAARPARSRRVPRFDLLELDRYASLAVQVSRGCPFRCEFCDIIEMFGRVPRLKTPEQVLAELEALRRLGGRGAALLRGRQLHRQPAPGGRRSCPQVARLAARARAPVRPLHRGEPRPRRATRSWSSAMVEAGLRARCSSASRPRRPESLAERRQDARTSAWTPARGGGAGSPRPASRSSPASSSGFDADGAAIFDRQLEFISRIPCPGRWWACSPPCPGPRCGAAWSRRAGCGRSPAATSSSGPTSSRPWTRQKLLARLPPPPRRRSTPPRPTTRAAPSTSTARPWAGSRFGPARSGPWRGR